VRFEPPTSPETDERNNPGRRVFDHFFAMEVTWR